MAKEAAQRIHEARITIRQAHKVIVRKIQIVRELRTRIKQWEIEHSEQRARYRRAIHA